MVAEPRREFRLRDEGSRFVRGKGGAMVPLCFDPVEAYHTHLSDPDLYVDIETGGLNPWRDPVAVVSIYGPRSGVCSVLHVRGAIPEPIVELLSRPGVTQTKHNGTAFDDLFLAANGVDVFKPTLRDTLVAELVTIKTARRDTRVSLQSSVKRRTGVQLNKSIDHRTWMQPTLTEEQLAYAGGDVVHLPALYSEQRSAVRGTPQERALDTEEALIPAVIRTTLNGLPFSTRVHGLYTKQLAKDKDKAEDTLVQAFGPINLRSAKQVKEALADYGVVVPDTTHDALVEISEMGGRSGEVVDLILNFKKPDQRLKMYSDDWLARHVVSDWVHPRVWQVGTDTGRMSNSDPNLQQIPKDDARKMFEAPEGYCILSADYSQLEVRVAAYYARDEAMVEALNSEDLHTAVAADVFIRPAELVSSDERKLAKAAVFTLLFGGGATRLYDYARHNGSAITEEAARILVKRFFARFAGLAAMREQAFATARRGGAVALDLPTGLRRTLAGQTLRGTTVLNTLVQGTAAAGLKFAAVEAHKRGLTKYIGAFVHDEVVACVPLNEVEEYAEALGECMIAGMWRALEFDTTPRLRIRVGLEVDRTWGGSRLLAREKDGKLERYEDEAEVAFFRALQGRMGATDMNKESKSYRNPGQMGAR